MKAEDPTGLSRTIVAPSTSATRRRSALGETGTSTVVTAEIPAVPAGPQYGVLLPDGSIWYPGSRRRLPAPLVLRVVVWALAFLVLIAAAGDFIIRSHPGWVDPLRRIVSPAAASSPPVHHTTGGTTAGTTGAASAVALKETTPAPAGLPPKTTSYTVTGVSSFQVVVKTTQVTYVQAYQLVNGRDSGSPVFLGDIQPGSTQAISASGPLDVQVAAGGATVSVQSGGRQIGTVATPPIVPWDFWFQPAS